MAVGLMLKLKEIVSKMLPKKSVEDVLHVTPNISDRMMDAIQLWADMYEGNSPWLKEPTYENPSRITSLGLPALIASEKARMATLEMKSEISAPMVDSDDPNDTTQPDDVNTMSKPNIGSNSSDKVSSQPNIYAQKVSVPAGPTERAEFLEANYKKLLRQIRRQLEYGIAKGGLVIKPYVIMHDTSNVDSQNSRENSDSSASKSTSTTTTTNNNKSSNSVFSYNPNLPDAEIAFDYIQADRFFPFTFDADDRVTEAAFVQTKVDKVRERVFIRLEHHKLEGHTVTVQNFAFESTDMSLANTNNLRSASNLGTPISLKQVPEWANLEPRVQIADCDRLLFAYFRMPEANTVDPYSPLGVSGYSRVVNLIKDADRQYSSLLWEFEAGEMAIDVDRDMLESVEGLGSALPILQKRLFRKVDLNNEETYNVFAPQLRDTSYANGLNNILIRIEDAIGLSRGTLSEVHQQEAKTATELKILKQRSYATNADIQTALQMALEDVVYIMDVYCTLYSLTPDGDYEISFEWDDSIIVDSESELSKRLSLMQNGIDSKLETRMWYHGETENQAKAALQQVALEAQENARQQAQAEQLKAEALGQTDQQEEGESATKSPADTTAKHESQAKQADRLDNPDKSKTADQIKQ